MSRPAIRVESASQAQVETLFGRSLKRSANAIALVREADGELVGCAGIFPDDARLVIFSKLTAEARACPRAIVKGYRVLLELADRRGLPLHARPDPEVEASERFLAHMGFAPITRDCWQRLPKGLEAAWLK